MHDDQRMRAGAFATLLLVICGLAPPAAAVYGGSVVAPGQGGSVVYFRWRRGRRSGSCSGVLISERAVLTAAHCVRTRRDGPRRVRAVRIGNPRGRTARVTVASIIVHPAYEARRPERGSDLAILLLKRPVTDRVPLRVARPDEDPTRQGERIAIRGFGLTRRGRKLVRSRGLRETVQEHLSPFHCFSGRVKRMAKTRLCAASPKSGVCPGDSGAPATLRRGARDILVGIVSLAIDGRRCAKTATTLIRVSAFRDWIAQVTAVQLPGRGPTARQKQLAEQALNEAWSLYRRGSYAKAIARVLSSLRTTPRNNAARSILGACYCYQRRANEAQAIYDQLDSKRRKLLCAICRRSAIRLEDRGARACDPGRQR